MANLFERGILLGLGALDLTRERAEQLLDELVNQGAVQREEGKKLVKELLERGEQQRSDLKITIKREFDRLQEQSNLATKKELRELEERIKALEEKALPVIPSSEQEPPWK